ncbi:MAG: murein peptide amidase A [Proteobacteria bacterium]|nr:MAG: murein peptide amidase A [Pseudomonadota bacterium]
MIFSGLTFLMLVTLPMAYAADAPAVAAKPSLPEQCFAAMSALPGKSNPEALRKACASASQVEGCVSEDGVPIFHVNKPAAKTEAVIRKILVFSLIHGDEFPSGSVSRSWMERLTAIDPRNEWRVVPILNPDGLKNKTRYNANGVDVNRNFPTNDWSEKATVYWEKHTKRDKRRFPGKEANSEKETRCAIAHIDDYKPDLILSIHTPYNVLDFDGPKINPPKFGPIPWRSLGNYPGSLGRYMWVDRSRPTLTVELAGKGVVDKLEQFDRLQDISGDIAIKAETIMKSPDFKKEAPKTGEDAPPKKP